MVGFAIVMFVLGGVLPSTFLNPAAGCWKRPASTNIEWHFIQVWGKTLRHWRKMVVDWLIYYILYVCFFTLTGMYVFEYLKLIREQSAVSIFLICFNRKDWYSCLVIWKQFLLRIVQTVFDTTACICCGTQIPHSSVGIPWSTMICKDFFPPKCTIRHDGQPKDQPEIDIGSVWNKKIGPTIPTIMFTDRWPLWLPFSADFWAVTRYVEIGSRV